MLSPEDLFPLYAELALGLAGFVGVVSAFAGRDREFRPTERVRFLAVTLASASVLAGCFAFFTALAAGYEVHHAFRVTGAIGLGVSATGGMPLFVTSWKRASDPDSTSEPWSLYVSLATFILLWSLYGAAMLGQDGFVLLVAGFSIHLLHGLWMFIRLLTRPN